MKKSKNNKNNLVLTIILTILPIIYFAIATFYTLDVFTIKLHTDLGYETSKILEMHDVFYETLMFNGIWIALYILFLLFLFLNIMLYKKGKKTVFIIFNIAILVAAIISYYFFGIIIIPLIFISLAIVSLVLSYNLK